MRIAYQGEPGAYSEAAALRFNPNADPVPRPSFDDVFQAVAQGEATHGILPIENTIGGSIHRNYDLLLEHELPIVAEVKQPIVHHLIVRDGTRLEDVRKVYSHPQGLAQCERFLRTLDGVEMVPTYDTAGSAKMIQEQAPPRLSTTNRTLRGDVETITMKALEKDRHRRYATAAALADDIRRYLEGAATEMPRRRQSAALGRWLATGAPLVPLDELAWAAWGFDSA